MKKAAFMILFIVFSALGSYTELCDLDVATGVAVDKDESGWTVRCEVFLPSSDSDFGSGCSVREGRGATLAEALESLSESDPKQLWLGSNQLYLIGPGAVCDPELRRHLMSGGVNHRAVTVLCDGAKTFFDGESLQSLSLARKARRESRSRGMPLPRVTEYLRGGRLLRLTEAGL